MSVLDATCLITSLNLMAVGDCERAFAAAASADGIVLVPARVPWLNQRGYFGLPDAAMGALEPLNEIFKRLGGLEDDQRSKNLTALPGDFLHQATGTFIEVDESQHFTSFRLASLDCYPTDAPLGFELDLYREICRDWARRSDGYRKSKPARGFGPAGRQRQRAYHDALRDLVVPAMGHPPVIRVPAPNRDGAAAYARVRVQLEGLGR